MYPIAGHFSNDFLKTEKSHTSISVAVAMAIDFPSDEKVGNREPACLVCFEVVRSQRSKSRRDVSPTRNFPSGETAPIRLMPSVLVVIWRVFFPVTTFQRLIPCCGPTARIVSLFTHVAHQKAGLESASTSR